MFRNLLTFLYILTAAFCNSERSNEAIDSNFLESVLDAEECDQQVKTIRENLLLLMQFADAGIRFPKGVLIGSTTDLGNYHQCLGIEHYINEMNIQGKFCLIRVPLNQTIQLPGFEYNQDPFSEIVGTVYLDRESIKKVEEFNLRRAQILAMSGNLNPLEERYTRTIPPNPLSTVTLTLGVCVPKPCTTEQAITSLLFNITEVGFEYTDNFCRLPGDKPWTGAEYTAVIVFSVIGFLTLLSTCYDLIHRFIFKSDSKRINPVYRSFSLYTNGQRLMTFSSGSGTIQCIDGIRTIAMIWIIFGHSFGSEPHLANPLDSWTWMFSAESLWITAATVTVDTFFTLGGLLLIYTSAKKMTGTKLLKNFHWFYLSRIVRITPLLAAAVLLEASFYNHLSDGPSWGTVAYRTNVCRNDWWYTILHVQNLLIPRNMCVGHSWYVAIDMHMYVVSPIIIYWVFTGKKRNAWIALITGLSAILIASTIFNYIKNFQGGIIVPGRENSADYMPIYYFNTLTRASPFFVGLIAGYILHLYRDTKLHMPWILAAIFWLVSAGIVSGIFYYKYLIMQFDWNNQFMDNFMNSFMRPAWACCISWMIFACVHGYAGPINWFLSLEIWRLPARLTYGMYLFHYPLMFAINGSAITPVYFSVGLFTFKSLSHLVLALVMSFILTLVVDSPFTVLYGQLLVKVQKREKQHVEKENQAPKVDDTDNKEHLNEAQTSDLKLDGAQETNGRTVTDK